MRMKHKKLKKRYNKLECDLFEDSDEELDVREVTNEQHAEPSGDLRIEPAVERTGDLRIEQHVEPIIRTVKRPIKKGSWRSVISGF